MKPKYTKANLCFYLSVMAGKTIREMKEETGAHTDKEVHAMGLVEEAERLIERAQKLFNE